MEGTIQSGYQEVRPAAEVGDTVTFTASFSRADDDASMAFFKRPRKASIVATGEVVA